jgi:hypothetical protein
MLNCTALMLAATLVAGQPGQDPATSARPSTEGLGEYQDFTWERLDARLSKRPHELRKLDLEMTFFAPRLERMLAEVHTELAQLASVRPKIHGSPSFPGPTGQE